MGAYANLQGFFYSLHLSCDRAILQLCTLILTACYAIATVCRMSALIGFFSPFSIGMCAGVFLTACLKVMQAARAKNHCQKARLVSSLCFLSQKELGKLSRIGERKFPSWITDSDSEKVPWLNKQLKEVWPYLNKAASAIIKDAVSSTLEEYKVGIITNLAVKHVTLGNISPKITGVKLSRTGRDEISVFAGLDWSHSTEQELTLQASVALMPSILVKVSQIKFKATLRIVLKPLMNVLPGFGAIMLSFTEQPNVSMDIAILGGDITAIPGMEKMIDNIIKTSLQDLLVWPARMVFPVVQGDFSFLELRPTGYLEVVLIEARDIPKMDFVGKTDPFVYLYLHQKQSAMKRSSVRASNHFPVWNEVFLLEVEDVSSQHLSVRLMDDEQFQRSEYVGSRKYKLSNLTPGTPKGLWLELVSNPEKPLEGRSRGSVHLCLTYRQYNGNDEEIDSPLKKMKPLRKGAGDGIPYELYRREFVQLGGTPEESSSDSVERRKHGFGVKSYFGKVFGSSKEEKAAEVLEDYGVSATATEVVRGGRPLGAAGKIESSGGHGF